MQDQLPDGIYFDLDENVYHAQHRLSPSGMTKMMESPSAWWADSWLNPDREEREETDALKLGSAYHVARLEPEKFVTQYAPLPRQGDFIPAPLTSDTAVCARLKELDLPQRPKGEDILTRAQRLQEADPDVNIWSIIMADFERETAGKIPLKPRDWDRILKDGRNFRMNPEIEELVTHGAAEVSILYTCPETGVPMKTRPDYLLPDAYVDLKTWDMKRFGVPGNRAILDAFKYNGYHRSAWTMLEALELVRLDKVPLAPVENQKHLDLIKAIRKRPTNLDCWFIFQRKGGIPDIRARKVELMRLPQGVKEQDINASTEKFRRDVSILGRKAAQETLACKRSFLEATELYGSGPWFPRDIIGEFTDEDFNDYWLDSTEEPR
jgi:hypothetical protein